MAQRTGRVLIVPEELERILQDLTVNHGLVIGVQEKNEYIRAEFSPRFCENHRYAVHFALAFTWPVSNDWDLRGTSEPVLILTNPFNYEGWFSDLQFGTGFDNTMPAEAIKQKLQLFRLFNSKLRRLGLSCIPLRHGTSGAVILRPPKASPGALEVFQSGGRFAMSAWGEMRARVFYVADGEQTQ